MKRFTQSPTVKIPRVMLTRALGKLRGSRLSFSRYVEILIRLDMKKKIVPPLRAGRTKEGGA